MKKITILLLLAFMFFKTEATPFITQWDIPSDNYKVEFHLSTHYTLEDYDMDIDWGDGTKDHNKFDHIYKKTGTYEIKMTGKYPGILLSTRATNAFVVDEPAFITVKAWGDHEWLTMDNMFAYCNSFKKIEADDVPNLSKTTNMSYMFTGSKNFDHDISNWDVSNVKNMGGMFDKTSFNHDISNWDVSNVTIMHWMFQEATKFNQDLGKWNVSNVKDMARMFEGATSFNQNIGNWDVSNVTIMHAMFNGASKFNQDLGKWNVSKVKDMDRMFEGAERFNTDLKGAIYKKIKK